MTKETTNNNKLSGIKSKLAAAVCMLLVAVIMVVSSTYAWFTLSTAPEVTGITTAVGANGALEMLLLTKDDNGKWVYKDAPVTDGIDENIYWGNLVNLSDDYGLEKITLYPSTLNLDLNGNIPESGLLKTPKYGSDGRVEEIVANTYTGTLVDNSFMPNTNYGVRAVGTTSSMTPRQLAYRNALAEASTAMTKAKNLASQSLNDNGSALANIAIKHGIDENGTDEYGTKDVNSLLAIVNALLGTKNGEVDGILEYIEKAYMQYIVAYSASSAVDKEGVDTENLYKDIQTLVEADGATLSSVLTQLSSNEVTLPEFMYKGDQTTGYMDKLIATNTQVENAKGDLEKLLEESNITESSGLKWDDISTPLYKLADTNSMEVNGIAAGEIRDGDNMNTLVNKVAVGGLEVTMSTGGGVYADVADHCGDYSASITIDEVSYSGLTLKNMTARMQTNGYLTGETDSATGEPVKGDNPYLVVTGTAIKGNSPKSTSNANQALSEYYGYVIDLAFRTNAAESNLLLQTDAIDRIYGEDNTYEETQGSGSSMTFAATTNDFGTDKVKNLMSCIRIVFFDTEKGTVLGCAKLDTANATVGADGVTANMYLYIDEYEATLSNDTTVTCYAKTSADGTIKYYSDVAYTQEVTLKADTEPTKKGEKKLTGTDAVITALVQNNPVQVSTLVYLDGETIGNDDVVANTAKSVSGNMNLQFSSSANLVPMEYADLHIPSGSSSSTTEDENQTESSGT